MFVPGNRERFLEKACTCNSDAVLLDLEDGVLPADKERAREMTAAALARPWGRSLRYVRLNALSTQWFREDLEAVVRPGLDGVCMTKVSGSDDILQGATIIEALERRAGLESGSVRILAAIESARGLIEAPAIADSHARLIGLMFGAEDYALDVGLGTHRQGEAAELIHARSSVVVAATAARLLSIDGVYPNIDDHEGLERDAIQARRLGFTSKSTFNPKQIDLINQVFSPRPDEVAYARKIADAFHEAETRGDASVAVGGQLVDRPIVLRALRILEEAED
jgi:citrate lyase subunit beta/citryl-CoA lyase